jgi:nicotinamide mononucleotide (NMN) deamidase PncC
MNKQILILLLLCRIVFFGLAAAQDVTRSCTAQYSVSVTSINGAAGQTYPSFSGQGTVGYFNPNEARRRARHNLDECVQAAWDNRDMVSRPTQCTETNQIFSYPSI